MEKCFFYISSWDSSIIEYLESLPNPFSDDQVCNCNPMQLWRKWMVSLYKDTFDSKYCQSDNVPLTINFLPCSSNQLNLQSCTLFFWDGPVRCDKRMTLQPRLLSPAGRRRRDWGDLVCCLPPSLCIPTPTGDVWLVLAVSSPLPSPLTRLPLIRLTCQHSLPAKPWLCLVSHPDNPGEQHQEINKISPAGPEHTTLRLHNRGRIENQQQRKPKVSLIKIWSTHFSSELNYRSPVVTIMTRMIITSWFTVYPSESHMATLQVRSHIFH